MGLSLRIKETKLGQVFTNIEVAEYMVSLLDSNHDAHLLDPCFGEGVFLKAAKNAGYSKVDGCEIDEQLFVEVKNKYQGFNLWNTDFLTMKFESKYDVIIMNPPYIRHEKIDNLKSYGITKKEIRANRLFSGLPKTANIYMYFIYKSIDLLKDNGEMVVIFPSNWLKAKLGLEFKDFLYSRCTLIKQIHITGNIFDREALVDVVILHIRKGISTNKLEVKNFKILNGKFINQENIVSAIDLGFSLPFSKIGRVRRGITTGCNEMYINPIFDASRNIFKIISTPKAVFGYTTENIKCDSILITKLPIDDNVKKYIDFWQKKIISDEKPKTLYEKIVNGSERWHEITPFDGRGILFSYIIRNDMKFVYNNSNHLVRDNFYIITPTVDELLVFALLNNYYTYYQLEKIGKQYGAGLLKVQKYDIEALSFPNIDLFSNEDIRALKREVMELIKTGTDQHIDGITEIVSQYSTVSARKIKELYICVKSHRLE